MVKLDCEKFLLGFVTAVLTFFIAGLLIFCASKHVDNLGAYSIPSETGLLIPSDCNSVANPQSTIMPQPEYEQASPNRKRHTGYVIRGLRNGGIFVRHTALSTTFGCGCDLEDLDREYSDRS